VQFLWKQGFFAFLKPDQNEGLNAMATAPNKGMEPTTSSLHP